MENGHRKESRRRQQAGAARRPIGRPFKMGVFGALLALVMAAGCTDPQVPRPPATPTGLTAQGGEGEVALSWQANTEPDLLRYSIYRGEDGDQLEHVANVPAGTESFSDADVEMGVTYRYAVAAENQHGLTSGPSEPVSATPVAAAGEAPEIVSTQPADGDADVPLNTDIVLAFSKEMEQEATEAAFRMEPALECEFSWNAAGTRLTCTPQDDLAADTEYQVTILAEARDAAGIDLGSDTSFHFKSGSRRGDPEAAVDSVTVSPESAEITVAGSTRLEAEVTGRGDPSQDVTWSSSDEAVAAVDDGGQVTGVGEGQATITATSVADPTVSGSAELTVSLAVDAGELSPGEMTEFVDGLHIGAHPDALTEPVEVEIEWFDPTGDPAFPTAGQGVERVDRFVRITAPDVDEPWVDTPVDTGLIIVLPVPEEFDESRLYPLQYMYGDFVEFDAAHEGEHNHHHGDAPDVWAPISGVFDPKHRVFVVALPIVGGRDYPTQLGVVEHREQQTKKSEEVLDEIIDELFGASESASAPSSAQRLDDFERETDIGVAGHRFLHSARFRVSCMVEDCDSAADVVDTVGEALDEALPVYHQMNDSPQPRLRTTLLSRLNPFRSTYRYYLMDEHSDTLCGGSFRGFYRRDQRVAVTCMNAANQGLERVALTTAHELFHAMQYGYGHSGRDSFLLEGTARLAEDVSAPLEVSGIEHPPTLDVSFADERPYRGEYFFRYLFLREGLGFDRMGDLFAKGLHLRHVDDFVRRHTTLDGLGDSYWAWAKDQAFEKSVPLGPDPHGNPVPNGAPCQLNGSVATSGSATITAQSWQHAAIDFTLDPLSARVFEVTVDFGDPELSFYTTTASVEPEHSDLNIKPYFQDDPIDCRDRSDGSVERGVLYQWRGDPIRSYILIANTSRVATYEGRLEFSEPREPPIVESAGDSAIGSELEQLPFAPNQ